MNVFKLVFGVIVLFNCGNKPQDGEIDAPKETISFYNLEIDANESKGLVSPLLMGFGTIYSFEKDEMWLEGKGTLPTMLKRFKTGILRYPGGAPTNRYHWNDLNGQGWKDNWDPQYDHSNDLPASDYMDVDEYMKNVTEIGAEPMLGINMGSGLKYNRVQDGVDEAVALMQYCKDKGYDVKYWYLDNEPYHKGANYLMTSQEYADQINLYVPALKAVNPEIEIIINWKSKITEENGSLKNIITNAGQNIDIVEVHYYWNHGHATFNNWLSSYPMNTTSQYYNGFSYVREIEEFRSLVSSLGYDHIKLASNEWNVGPVDNQAEIPTKFESALMVSEQFSQFIDANLFMACFWGLHWPNGEGSEVNRYVLDPTNDYKENAMATVFDLFVNAMGGTQVACDSDKNEVYDIAVIDKLNDKMYVYIVNKDQTYLRLSTGLQINNFEIGKIEAVSFVGDHNGDGELIEIDTHIENQNRIITNLPKNSLTRIVITK